MSPELISVLIPSLNEAADIAFCIAAVGAQDVGADQIQLILVDGNSHDGTVDVALGEASKHGFAEVRVLTNSARTTPSSLNLGLAEARGEVLCRVDARSFLPPEYVRRCAELLADCEIAVVGGAQLARAAPGAGPIARGIARALRNPYATGLSRYRLRRSSGPADTCYLGAFRTADLREVAGWDVRFAANQDYELNARMRQRGSVWFAHDLVVAYRPRPDLRSLARQYRRFGRWKAGAWTETRLGLAPRHIVLLAAPPVALALAIGFGGRHPLAAPVGVLVAGLALDSFAGERCGVAERSVAVLAMGVSAGSWWLGILEQLVRYVGGHRLFGVAQSS